MYLLVNLLIKLSMLQSAWGLAPPLKTHWYNMAACILSYKGCGSGYK